MTLWILSKNKMTDGDDTDHSALLAAAERLDPVCDELGVRKLSDFLDWTDFNANMSEDEEFPSPEELKELASWFTPNEALTVLNALRGKLSTAGYPLESLFEEGERGYSKYLLDELDDCIAKVEEIEAEGDLFHFCVVM